MAFPAGKLKHYDESLQVSLLGQVPGESVGVQSGDGHLYMVTAYDLSSARSRLRDDWFHLYATSIGEAGGTVPRPISLDGVCGYEVIGHEMNHGPAKPKPFDLRRRMYSVGDTLYDLDIVSRPGRTLSPENADRFFSSFKLLAPARQGPR